MNRAELIQTLKRLGYLGALILIAIGVISAVEWKQVSKVEAIDIDIEALESGDFLLDSTDVLTTIERSFGYDLRGQQIAKIDVERLERVLEADPFVLGADVFIDARNRIKISLSQREPVLRIIDDNGLNYYLDKDGNKMPLSVHFAAKLLVATGNLPPFVPDFLEREKHLLKDLFMLTQRFREDPFLYALIEQIHINAGEFALTPKIGKQIIEFGKYERVEEKIRNLKLFYQEALPYEGWQKFKKIDLAFEGQVVGVR